MNKNSTKKSGFTLIETLLYIALFAIVIGGGMVATYQIIQATDANRNQIILQEEANFIFRKIEWALTGATGICSSSGSSLTVTKIIPVSCLITANLLVFDLNGSNIRLTRGNALPTTLNSSNILSSNLAFTVSGGIPNGVTTKFTLITVQNGRAASQDFSFTKYLRQ